MTDKSYLFRNLQTSHRTSSTDIVRLLILLYPKQHWTQADRHSFVLVTCKNDGPLVFETQSYLWKLFVPSPKMPQYEKEWFSVKQISAWQALKRKSVLSIGTEPTQLVSHAMIKMKRGAKSLYSNQCSLIFYPSTSRANEAVNMCWN